MMRARSGDYFERVVGGKRGQMLIAGDLADADQRNSYSAHL
jgi:hypothetical protein